MKRLLLFVFAIMPLLAFATDEICPAGYYPAEYIELEYIESTGTQYIDTDAILSSTSKVEIKFNISTSSVTGSQYAFGTYGGSKNFGFNIASSGIFCVWGGSSTTSGGSSISIYNTDNTVILDSTGCYVNTEKKYTPLGSFIGTNNAYLFWADGTAQPKTVGKIYYCNIWQNSELVRNFIPVRRASDGAVGMYDGVENKFYGNDGTGEFIAGPETGNSFIIDENNIICVSCPANTYKPNAGNESCTKCPTGTFSPIGSTQLSDCAKILRVKDYVVYMPLGKRTEHGLCVMSDGKKYCADVYERQ